ncbi:hypothetical protein CTAYLR_001276 [Chrysophaeum taylorii]|uniref:Uncharacterized protein n=1 Tax=Chrysophaeum taylorii TaxID=2483200 RepID=A0AAD7XNM3_9STRA|nr:hypothetical protein CTAYLR_001276 [Chrysophaeum taylorii]
MMLGSVAQALGTYSLVLASGSPRRKDLLDQMLPETVSFRVETSGFEEDLPKTEPSAYVMETARCKGVEVFERCGGNALVIAADTVVVGVDGAILEKPASEADALRVLSSLSGRTHAVLTGVALFRRGRTITFFERTEVTFSPLSEDTIRAYIATGEPMDKAGSYGIQGRAGPFVEKLEGDYFNVVGLPMNRLSRELVAFVRDD